MTKYAAKSHDGKLYVERTADGGIEYAGPYPYEELRPKIQALQNGTIEWSDLNPVPELAPLDYWPRRVGTHRVDVQRADGGYRVTVAKPPRNVQRDGEVESIPGFDATSRALYPTEGEAKLAATQITRDLRGDGELRETDFDVEDRVGTPPRPDRMQRAPITSAEYRQDRPFEVRSRLPRRRDNYFHAVQDGDDHRVAFYGNNSVSATPPLASREEAEELATKLNRLQQRGVHIPFKAYRFGQSRQSDRRVFVDQVGGKHRVVFNGPNKLGRSRPFETEQEADAARAVIAGQIRDRSTIDWDAYGFRWGKHPDRLRLREVEDGFRLEYYYKENIASSDVVYASKAEATRALDGQRRRLYQGETLDTSGWSFRRSGESLSLKVVQGRDERFYIATGTGRFFHVGFDDHASAEAKRGALEGEIFEGMVPEGPEWPFADQLPRLRLSKTAEAAVDELAGSLRSNDLGETASAQLDRASADLAKQLETALEPLSAAEKRALLGDLKQFAQVKEIRAELGMLRDLLDDPKFQGSPHDPAAQAEAEPYREKRMLLESHLAELPRENQLAGGIARQLRGKEFDPEALARPLDDPFHAHGFDLLDSYDTVQREYLPRVAALAQAAQKAGREVPAELLGQEPTKWFGTVKNMAPPQLSGLISTAKRSIQAARRVMQPERAAGVSR